MKSFTKYTIKKSLKRILIYRTSLLRLKEMGVQRIYSFLLGQETGVTAAQVRKDFSQYGIKGNHRGGYNINDLLISINNLFHKKYSHNIIMVGMGNIGNAIAKYSKFVDRKINIVACFDIDPSKQSRRSGIPVYSMNRLEEIINRFQVKVAIIAVTELSAQDVCNRLINSGIMGIVNFAPVILKTPDNVIVNNVDLSNEIESVIYYVSKD